MKISTVKAFDVAELPADIGGKITPLVDYINRGFDQIITALQGNLTFTDNMKGEHRTVSLVHDVAKECYFDKDYELAGILVEKSGTPVTSFSWYKSRAGYLYIMAAFDGAPTEAVDVRLLIVRT